MDETKIYSASEIREADIADTIKDVVDILDEKGYNPINQIVGYLMSNDPGYISSFKDARGKLTKFERAQVIEVLVKDFLK